MSRGISEKITYKPYSQSEQWLLPPSLDELVPENHFVRTVSKTVYDLDIEKIFAKNTKGVGASRYHPVMLMKVLIYCYMTGIYSSRMIAKQCRENVNVMWPTGFQKPDFRTINTFSKWKTKRLNRRNICRNSETIKQERIRKPRKIFCRWQKNRKCNK